MLTTLKFANRSRLILLLSVVAAGIVARLGMTQFGHNFDFDSYLVVVDARKTGLTPWQTNRYNYGPVWAIFLYLFDWLSSTFGIDFRMLVVLLLSLADLCIAAFLYRIRGPLIAAAFFLNPVSLIISGTHNQFDNVAIAMVCLAVIINGDRRIGSIDLKDVGSIALVGLSLMTKHIFLLFVVWIAIRQRDRCRAIAFALGPMLMFLLSFVPFLSSSSDAIWLNVIEYRSYDNAPFWSAIGVFQILGSTLTAVLFVVLMIVLGFRFRNRTLTDSLAIYSVLVVGLSPAIANQYLAIALVGVFGFLNIFYGFFLVYASFWLTINGDGLSLERPLKRFLPELFRSEILWSLATVGYRLLAVFLIAGFALQLVQERRSVKLSHRPDT